MEASVAVLDQLTELHCKVAKYILQFLGKIAIITIITTITIHLQNQSEAPK